jgi:hypothetical protein
VPLVQACGIGAELVGGALVPHQPMTVRRRPTSDKNSYHRSAPSISDVASMHLPFNPKFEIANPKSRDC